MIARTAPGFDRSTLYSRHQDQNGGAGMTTGAKIAIGCGIAVVVAGIAAVVTIGMGAYWIKGKVEQTAGDLTKRTQELETYQKKANANPFTRPADGVIQEPRLMKFLEVRKGVHSVYELHRAEFEGMKDKKEASLSDVMTVGGILLEARLALVKSLAAVGMSEEEYHFIVQQVYQSAWASAAQKEGGQQPADVMDQGLKAYREQTRAGMEGLEKAGQAGLEGVPKVSEEDKKKMEEAADEMIKEAHKGAELMRAPQANIDLFRKHEAEIKKYAMEGLALAGL